MKKVRVFLSFLFAMFLFIPTSFAITINDLADADETLSVDKNIAGTSFKAGNNVNLSSKIDGISFVAGNNVDDSSESDYAFIAGNMVNLKDVKTKDLFVAANQLTIKTDYIERDVYAVADTVNIDGTIGRNLYVGASKVNINGTIIGELVIDADNIVISENTVVRGTLKYNEDAKITNNSKNKIKTKTYKSTNNEKSIDFTSKIFDVLESFGNILVLGLILLMVFKKLFDKIDSVELNGSNIIKNIGFGLLLLFVIPIATLIFILTSIGVATAFIGIALYVIILYSSTVFTSYYFGKKILNSKIDNDYLILILSLLVLCIVNAVPLIGSLTSLVSLLFGTGIFITSTYEILFPKKKSKK